MREGEIRNPIVKEDDTGVWCIFLFESCQKRKKKKGNVSLDRKGVDLI